MKKRKSVKTKNEWFLYLALIIVFGAAYVEKRFDNVPGSISVVMYTIVILLMFCYIIFKSSDYLHKK